MPSSSHLTEANWHDRVARRPLRTAYLVIACWLSATAIVMWQLNPISIVDLAALCTGVR